MIWLIKFAMCTMMPRSDALPGIGDTDLDGFLRRMKKETNLYWAGLVLGAVVFALTPLLTIGVPLPAFALPRQALARPPEKVLAHPSYLVRQAAFLIRVSGGRCWGADETVRARFDLPAYPPDPGTFRNHEPHSAFARAERASRSRRTTWSSAAEPAGRPRR